MSKGKGKATAKGPGQASISSFFSPSPQKRRQRSGSPIDLTGDSDLLDRDARSKRRRTTTTSSPFFSNQSLPAGRVDEAIPSAAQSAAEKYRFDPTSTALERPQSAAEEAILRKRREKARRILLGAKDIFPGRRQPDMLEFEAEDDDEEERGERGGGEDSGEESDSKFKDTLSFFTNAASKGKGRASGRGKGSVGSTRGLPRVRKIVEIGPSGQPYTPLELQVRDIKKKYPNTILMFEVGYKMQFYGEDAKIASRELAITCYPKRNNLLATIPVHRQDIHLRKLLSKGYKVGIVGQAETAALKAIGDTRNELFSRQLTHLYTAATYVDRLDSADDLDSTNTPPLMCLVEELRGGMGVDEKVSISMISICASTGDVTWDQFEDNHMRTELETRMVHINPCELLLPESKLSKPTEKMLTYFAAHSHTEYQIRKERFPETYTYTEAFSYLTKFYTDKAKAAKGSESYRSGELMASVADFPKQVVIALAHIVKYLSAFDVADALLETKFFAKFTERSHMHLNGNTLTNLEIYRNETDFTRKGSLIWILDHTTTKFGSRMLRSWVGRPLVDKSILSQRTDAVDEILRTSSTKLTTLRQLLRKMPDLAKGLCRIQYGKCTPQELAVLFPAFNRIAVAFQPVEKPEDVGFQSPLLNDIVYTLTKLRDPIQSLLEAVSLKMAAEGKKELLWTDPNRYPAVDHINVSIQVVETELADELKNIRRLIKKPALTYTTWNEEEYLIEIGRDENRNIPVDWVQVSSTKRFRRYRTPKVREKLQQRAQLKEALEAESNRAFRSFLEEISHTHYAVLRDAVYKLSVADCLLSLALVAVQEGYVRPEFSDEGTIEIIEGRHPMVEALRDAPFVPNTVVMGGDSARSKVITGPNMGGKSSVVRMVALCAIMAQIGSYVPAAAMKIGMLDGILVRMGASDELARGRSTFMVEMQETSDILRLATPKTLVILDELGRGTSTFDGMAIASAVLQQLVQATKCKTLFITHYPQVATELERRFPLDLENLHMGYAEDTRIDGTREVTFLFKLAPSVTKESFGVECARLASLPELVLQLASVRSQDMRALVERRIRSNKIRKCGELLRTALSQTDRSLKSTVDELRILADSLSE